MNNETRTFPNALSILFSMLLAVGLLLTVTSAPAAHASTSSVAQAATKHKQAVRTLAAVKASAKAARMTHVKATERRKVLRQGRNDARTALAVEVAARDIATAAVSSANVEVSRAQSVFEDRKNRVTNLTKKLRQAQSNAAGTTKIQQIQAKLVTARTNYDAAAAKLAEAQAGMEAQQKLVDEAKQRIQIAEATYNAASANLAAAETAVQTAKANLDKKVAARKVAVKEMKQAAEALAEAKAAASSR